MKNIKISRTHINGIVLITNDDWDGEVYQMSRATFIENKDSDFLDRAGVYVIYADHFDKNEFGKEIYIGQGDDVRQRLISHAKEKPFWNKVLLFTSKKMNIALSFNIENQFILKARFANRYIVINQDIGQNKKLGQEDFLYLEEYLSKSFSLIDLAGIDIFKFNEDGVFFLKKRNNVAKLKIQCRTSKNVLILKGSQFGSFSIH